MAPLIDPLPPRAAKTFAIGARLEALLARRNLTPHELAAKAGVSERSVHRHLRNLPASRQVVKYYADALKISVEDFLAIEGASHLTGYLAWVRRAAAEVPFWPSSRALRRPALRDVYVAPPISEGATQLGVAELLQRRFVVVTGKAGTGKTTLVHALASGLAAPRSEVIPLLVDVSDLGPDDAIEGVGDLLAWLRSQWVKLPILPLLDELPGLLKRHQVMFLVDGLHDLERGDPRALRRAMELLNVLPRDCPNSAVIVTCRDEAFERIGSRLRSEYTRVTIDPMPASHVRQLVDQIGGLAGAPCLGTRLLASVEANAELGALLATALGTTILSLALLDESVKELGARSDVLDRCFEGLWPPVDALGAAAGAAERGALEPAFGPGLSPHGEVVDARAGMVQLSHELWRHDLVTREIVDTTAATPLGTWLGGLLTAPDAPETDALVQSALARLEDKRPGELFAVVATALDSLTDRPDGDIVAAAHRLRLIAVGLMRCALRADRSHLLLAAPGVADLAR